MAGIFEKKFCWITCENAEAKINLYSLEHRPIYIFRKSSFLGSDVEWKMVLYQCTLVGFQLDVKCEYFPVSCIASFVFFFQLNISNPTNDFWQLKRNTLMYLKWWIKSILHVRHMCCVLPPTLTSSKSNVVVWVSMDKSYCKTDAIQCWMK